jgi:hypothetical protein
MQAARLAKTMDVATGWTILRMMCQPPAQLQGAAHLHSGPQAHAGWVLACWQPQPQPRLQVSAGQVAHWQFDWVALFMAFLLEWLKEMPV